MDDLPQLMSYIQNNLMKRADIVTENGLFSGPGTGDDLKGLDEYATAFTGSGMAVSNANEFDVLISAILQVKKAFGVPTGFFVNESFLAKMITTKSTYGEYTEPLAFLGRDNEGYTTLQGVRLIGTNALDSLGIDFIGGDLSVVNVLFRQGMRVQIGLDGNDFINNKKTILLEQRLVQFVSANDTQTIIKGDFATAKALLEATT
jgi:HK97 family phage major capsid protein